MTFERAQTASESPRRPAGGGSPGGRAGAIARRLAAGLRKRDAAIATALAVLGGLLLLYAETLDLYRIITPSGSVSNAAGSVRTGGDQHSWALAVMGVAAAGAAVLAYATRQRLPALASLMLGIAALLVALAVDLPDVTASGVTTDLEVGDAEPAAGFWMELVGAVVLTVGAAFLASLLHPRRARRR
jgi:hypothetical protein